VNVRATAKEAMKDTSANTERFGLSCVFSRALISKAHSRRLGIVWKP
jgi:hypothetical protein